GQLTVELTVAVHAAPVIGVLRGDALQILGALVELRLQARRLIVDCTGAGAGLGLIGLDLRDGVRVHGPVEGDVIESFGGGRLGGAGVRTGAPVGEGVVGRIRHFYLSFSSSSTTSA